LSNVLFPGLWIADLIPLFSLLKFNMVKRIVLKLVKYEFFEANFSLDKEFIRVIRSGLVINVYYGIISHNFTLQLFIDDYFFIDSGVQY